MPFDEIEFLYQESNLRSNRAGTGGNTDGCSRHLVERQPDGLLLVENLHDVGKIKMKRMEALIEPDLVYPLLRGRDISRWEATPSACILMVQDLVKRTGYEESWLKVQYPRAYAYLKEFEDVLRQRSGYKKYFDPDKDAFYSMYDVAEYTFAPYKVVWTRVATDISAGVTGPKRVLGETSKPTVPIETATMVPFQDETESRYFASLMNSSPVRLVIDSYSSKGTGSFGSPHVLQHVAIPKFDSSNALHQSLASLSRRAQGLAAQGKAAEAELRQVEEEIDRLAAGLWGISEEELAEIQRGLD